MVSQSSDGASTNVKVSGVSMVNAKGTIMKKTNASFISALTIQLEYQHFLKHFVFH